MLGQQSYVARRRWTKCTIQTEHIQYTCIYYIQIHITSYIQMYIYASIDNWDAVYWYIPPLAVIYHIRPTTRDNVDLIKIHFRWVPIYSVCFVAWSCLCLCCFIVFRFLFLVISSTSFVELYTLCISGMIYVSIGYGYPYNVYLLSKEICIFL